MPKVRAADIEIHYEDQGHGRPVVLIHGWPLSGRSWEAQVGPLVAAGHRVITYDRRGFGMSDKPWNGYDYDTFTADLDALMSQLALSDVTLVGFSMGGGEVARYLGTRGPARVRKAVFASAVPPLLHKSMAHPDGALDDETIASFEAGVKADRPAFLDDFTKKFFSAGSKLKVSEPMRQYALGIALMASPKATLDCIAAFARTDFRNDLRRIDVPTLVIHGDADGIVPLDKSGERTALTVARARLVTIEGGPHGINASHADAFNASLLKFLAE